KGEARDDAGTVFGAMQSSDAVHTEAAVAVGGVKAMPAVRAMARKRKVDTTRVRATGPDGTVTVADVGQAAADGAAAMGARPVGAAMAASSNHQVANNPGTPDKELAAMAAPTSGQRGPVSASGKPMRTQPPGVAATGQPEQLKGVRRNMARVMADAHAQVVPTTLVDDADR